MYFGVKLLIKYNVNIYTYFLQKLHKQNLELVYNIITPDKHKYSMTYSTNMLAHLASWTTWYMVLGYEWFKLRLVYTSVRTDSTGKHRPIKSKTLHLAFKTTVEVFKLQKANFIICNVKTKQIICGLWSIIIIIDRM